MPQVCSKLAVSTWADCLRIQPEPFHRMIFYLLSSKFRARNLERYRLCLLKSPRVSPPKNTKIWETENVQKFEIVVCKASSCKVFLSIFPKSSCSKRRSSLQELKAAALRKRTAESKSRSLSASPCFIGVFG